MMDRIEFIKTSSLAILGTLLSPMYSCSPQKAKEELAKEIKRRTNWARNFEFKATDLKTPSTIEELQVLMKKEGERKAIGATHCFNGIADSPHTQVSLSKLKKLISIDEKAMTATFEGGIRYYELVTQLHEKGYALHNLAGLTDISVVGGCTTGTHGSGSNNGALATAISGVEICLADGSLVNLSRKDNPDIFDGVIISFGGLGIITKVVLDIEPAYDVRQDVFLSLPFENVAENFEAIMSSGYSVSLFTMWQDGIVNQAWVKRRVDLPVEDLGSEFFGGKASEIQVHPNELDPNSVTDQLGKPGVWYERLPHAKLNGIPEVGDELQSEYFVSIADAGEAMRAIEKLKDEMLPHLLICEIRTIDEDNLWMSPFYKRKSVAFHCSWKPNGPEVKKILGKIEAALAPFSVRPHWGKLYTMDTKVLQKSYEKLDDFRELLKTYDPNGRFSNDYLKRIVYSG